MKQAASNEMRQIKTYSVAAPALLVALWVTSSVCMAQDFTFKFVAAGSVSKGKGRLVQIDPVAQALALAAMTKSSPLSPKDELGAASDQNLAAGSMLPTPKSAKYGWFWEQVPPERDQVSGRFPKAMAQLGLGPGGSVVAAPRLQHMQNLASSYGTQILKSTIGTQVSPALVLAVIGIESAGQVKAVSTAGAQGLMQLMPDTAKRFGVNDAMDPVQNINGGVAYLDFLMRTFDQDPLMVIAAYNAGEGAVMANSGVPPFAETRDYVPKVLAAWQVAQGLCLSPPELMTDPCVFKVISSGN